MDSVHNGEVEMLIDKFGVSSFKIFMFYGIARPARAPATASASS